VRARLVAGATFVAVVALRRLNGPPVLLSPVTDQSAGLSPGQSRAASAVRSMKAPAPTGAVHAKAPAITA
jgi:hypothetical protein